MSDAPIVVYVTAPRDRAADLARALVERRVCACVNVLGEVRSIYAWKGVVYDDPESLLVIKSTAGALPRLREAVIGLHPYELPEVVAVPVVGGHEPYLDWIRGEVAEP